MKTTHFFRFLFAGMLFAVAWIALSSQALAYGIYTAGTTGNDSSYPQCSTSTYPQNSFGIVGVAGGRAFTDNPCLSKEFAWASALSSTPASLYMNLNSPIGSTASNGITGPYGHCKKSDKLCRAENYGYNAAQAASNYAANQSASSSMWWLDIETSNSWSSSTSLNRGTINGAIRFFTDKGVSVGIYSTPSMWSSITRSYANHLPVWIATASTTPSTHCSSTYGFTGGTVYLVQYPSGSRFDTDYAC
jgi:hypothetical protein